MPNGYNWNSAGGYRPDNIGVYGQVQVPPNMLGNQNLDRNAQTFRPSYIPGKTISNLKDIVPQDVPMDGSAAIFPMSDLSCIYVKAWGADGLIKDFKYVLEPANPEQKIPEGNFQETILDRLNSIEELVKKQSYNRPYKTYNPNYKRNNQNGSKKEDVKNDAE